MSSRPLTLSISAAAEAAEGLIVLVAGVVVGVLALTGRPSSLMGALVLALIGIACGVGIVWVGVNLWRAKRWSRAPAVVGHLLCLAVGYSLVQDHQAAFGVPLLVVAAVGVVMLFCPPTNRALIDQ